MLRISNLLSTKTRTHLRSFSKAKCTNSQDSNRMLALHLRSKVTPLLPLKPTRSRPTSLLEQTPKDSNPSPECLLSSSPVPCTRQRLRLQT
jgi:hypothetical protein